MGHWIRGFQPKLMSEKLWLVELGRGRTCHVDYVRYRWIGQESLDLGSSGQASSGKEIIYPVDRVRGAELSKIRLWGPIQLVK